MNNITKMQIRKPAHDVYEAFVDPEKIGNFWFSTSSERWEGGRTVTLTYKEYNAELQMEILETIPDEKIVTRWGANGEGHIVTMTFTETDPATTTVEIIEGEFDESDVYQLLDNKEGWVFMLTCLKGYLEFGVSQLRGGLVK
jgi:uncharacterized protein YndB with AHSA1/START domain